MKQSVSIGALWDWEGLFTWEGKGREGKKNRVPKCWERNVVRGIASKGLCADQPCLVTDFDTFLKTTLGLP